MKKIMFVAIAILIPLIIVSFFVFGMTQKPVSVAGLCVRVGEPLFPTIRIMPLDQFVSNMREVYQVNVNYTSNMVTIHNTSGGGIGSIDVPTFYVPIINC